MNRVILYTLRELLHKISNIEAMNFSGPEITIKGIHNSYSELFLGLHKYVDINDALLYGKCDILQFSWASMKLYMNTVTMGNHQLP